MSWHLSLPVVEATLINIIAFKFWACVPAAKCFKLERTRRKEREEVHPAKPVDEDGTTRHLRFQKISTRYDRDLLDKKVPRFYSLGGMIQPGCHV